MLLLVAVLSAALPQAPRESDAQSRLSSPFVAGNQFALVASGGISLGAYQAGVSYAFLRHLLATQQGGAGPQLNIATGASAGNINVFLAALSWVDPHPGSFSAFYNLFYSTWTGVGLKGLLPPDSDNPRFRSTDGLFTRAAFKDGEAEIENRLLGSAALRRGQGTLQLGVTLTKSSIDDQFVQRALGFPLQRYAVPLRLDVPEHCDRDCVHLSNVARDWGSKHPIAGRTLALPVRCGSERIEPQSILPVIEAASAFPVAFAPMTVFAAPTEAEPDCVKDDASAPGTPWQSRIVPAAAKGPRSDRYYDGGVFDNVPLGLAIEFAKDRPPGTGAQFYFYVHPDERRSGAQMPPEPFRKKGLAFQARLLSNFMDEGRRYELQGVVRHSAEEIGLEEGRFIASNRFYPVVGSYLGAFGAFLAHSYRVHDYTIGIYDGLVTLATVITKRSSCGEKGGPCVEGSSGYWARYGTVFAQLMNEIDPMQEDLPDGPPGSKIPLRNALAAMLEFELQATRSANWEVVSESLTKNAPEKDDWCAHPVWRIHRVLREMDARGRDVATSGERSQAGRFVAESESLEHFLYAVSAEDPQAAHACGQATTTTLPDSDRPGGAPFYAGGFWNAFRGLEEWEYTQIDRGLRRLQDIEKVDQSDREARGNALSGPVLPLARLGAATVMERGFNRVDFGPSSVERMAAGMPFVYRTAFHLLPYFWSTQVVGNEVELGWPINLRFHDGLYIPFGVSLLRTIPGKSDAPFVWGRKFTFLGVGYDPRGRIWDDLQLAIVSRGGLGKIADPDSYSFWNDDFGLELSVQLYSRLRVYAGLPRLYNRAGLPGSVGHRFTDAAVGLGLADVNGIFAWLVTSAVQWFRPAYAGEVAR